MKSISMLAIAAAWTLACLPAVDVQSQVIRVRDREETPPSVLLRIDGRRVTGAGELRVTLDTNAMAPRDDRKPPDLVLISEKKQRIELRGSGPLLASTGLLTRLRGIAEPQFRLQYEQRIEPDARRVFVALLPIGKNAPALLVHVDLGGNDPIRKEILPGLVLAQQDEPQAKPDVSGAAALRTWLAVDVGGLDQRLRLQGGETRAIAYRGATYRLHVYRSLRRDPGTDRQLPFEGEHYLLTATLTPQ